MLTTLKRNELEENATKQCKGKAMPTKVYIILLEADKSDTEKATLTVENKLVRKTMKKAKAHMVRVTKEYTK